MNNSREILSSKPASSDENETLLHNEDDESRTLLSPHEYRRESFDENTSSSSSSTTSVSSKKKKLIKSSSKSNEITKKNNEDSKKKSFKPSSKINEITRDIDEESPLLPFSPTSLSSSSSSSAAAITQASNEEGKNSDEDSSSILKSIGDFIVYGPSLGNGNVDSKADKKKIPWQWYHAWDITANAKEIFIRERDSDLNVLDGVRALAYLWVLDDHLYQALGTSIPGFSQWFSDSRGILIVAQSNKGDQGVVSFFLLSGFLIPFIFSRLVASKKETYMSGWTALEFLFRRYFRIAPTLYVATCIAILYGYLDVTNKSAATVFYGDCQYYWWENFLFINNMNSLAGWLDCYDSVWTISVEMQLYVLTIPVVYFYVWDKNYGRIAAFVWTVISLITRVVMCYYVDMYPTVYTFGGYVYLPSWTRAAEYGVGMGLFMMWDHFHGNKKNIPPPADLPTKIAFWACAYVIAAFAMFYLSVDEDVWWVGSEAQYWSFSYFLWAMGLSAIIYICIDGTFWPLKWILSWFIWFPIASLAYSAGVLNIIICYMYGDFMIGFDGEGVTWDQSTSFASYFYIYLQVMFISLSCGVVLSFLVERPFMNLAKQVKF